MGAILTVAGYVIGSGLIIMTLSAGVRILVGMWTNVTAPGPDHID